METVLKKYGIRPDPELGQNFMTKNKTIKIIVSLAKIKPKEKVLEIGAGMGFLTEELAKKSNDITAVEIDKKLISILRNELRDLKNVKVVKGNILKIIKKMDFDVIVSNLPYAISEALLRKLIFCEFKRAILVVPKGFAYRMIAKSRDRNYSKLSIFAQAFFNVKIENELSKDDFFPEPDTNSVVISMTKKPENHIQKLFIWETKKIKNSIQKALASDHKMTKKQAKEALKSLKINNNLLEKTTKNIDLKGLKTIINALIKQKKR